jgi:hypothetical protein
MKTLMMRLGTRKDLKIWRQQAGEFVFKQKGRVYKFKTGTPLGAADITGIVLPEGWRLEIECKVRDASGRMGTRSDEQIVWGTFVEASGGVYAAVDEDMGFEGAVWTIERAIIARRARS